MPYAFKPVIDGIGYIEIPDGGGFSCVYVVGTPQDALIVDTYLHRTGAQVIESLEHAGFKPQGIRGILITHAHLDHFGGASQLVRWCGAPVSAHLLTAAQVEDVPGHFAVPLGMSGNLSQWKEYKDHGGESVKVDRILREGDSVTHAGMTFDVYHTPGHERGLITLHERNRRLIFSGDLIQGGMDASKNWLGLYSDAAAQRRSLKRIAELEPEWNFKAHRMPRSHAELRQDFACAGVRVDAIEASLRNTLCETPLTVCELAIRVLQDVLGMRSETAPDYAVISVSAFLIDLERRGLARQLPNLTWRSY